MKKTYILVAINIVLAGCNSDGGTSDSSVGAAAVAVGSNTFTSTATNTGSITSTASSTATATTSATNTSTGTSTNTVTATEAWYDLQGNWSSGDYFNGSYNVRAEVASRPLVDSEWFYTNADGDSFVISRFYGEGYLRLSGKTVQKLNGCTPTSVQIKNSGAMGGTSYSMYKLPLFGGSYFITTNCGTSVSLNSPENFINRVTPVTDTSTARVLYNLVGMTANTGAGHFATFGVGSKASGIYGSYQFYQKGSYGDGVTWSNGGLGWLGLSGASVKDLGDCKPLTVTVFGVQVVAMSSHPVAGGIFLLTTSCGTTLRLN